MHVGHYKCTFPITGKNESKIGFKSVFCSDNVYFYRTKHYISYTINMIAVISHKMSY